VSRFLSRVCLIALVSAACGPDAIAPPSAFPSATPIPSASPTPAAATLIGTVVTEVDASIGVGIIDATGSKFDPPTLAIPLGVSVIWRNKDPLTHTTTSGTPTSPDGRWNGPLAVGKRFGFKFTQPGTFPYFCSIHGAAMTGTIVVR
jgi:plastocyanin